MLQMLQILILGISIFFKKILQCLGSNLHIISYFLSMVCFERVEIRSTFNDINIRNMICMVWTQAKEDNITIQDKTNSLMILFVRSNDFPVSSLKFFISDSRWPKKRRLQNLKKKKFWKALITLKELATYNHCVKIVKIQSFFWSAFSCIRTEWREIRTRKNSVFGIEEITITNINTFLKKLKTQFATRILHLKNITVKKNEPSPQFSWQLFSCH